MEPISVVREAVARVESGERVALCHVVETSGSVPCRSGWKKLVGTSGSTFGNLGGGAFEARVMADAGALLRGEQLWLRERYYCTEETNKGSATGMACGGYADVWIEIMSAAPVLLVCGGGAVGQALATNAAVCGFDSWVVDDRPEFADSALHPLATVLLVKSDYSDLELQRFGQRDLFICVVSRGWDTDAAALHTILMQDCPNIEYLGLMGSKRKIAKVRSQLVDQGVGWGTVHAPIGLAIGAQTPAEIAVSILAEMIQVRHRSAAEPVASLS